MVGWLFLAPVTSRVSPRRASYFFLLRQKKVTKKRRATSVPFGFLALLAAFGTLANSLRSNSASVLIRTLLRCSARPNGGGYLSARPLRELRPKGLFAALTSRGLGFPHFSRLTSLKARHAVPLQITPHPSPLTPHSSLLTPHPSPLTPHPSLLTPHPSLLIPHPSLLIPHPSLLTPHSSPLIPHSSLLTPHPSLLTPHSSLLTPHSSPLTPHPSPLTPHSSPLTPHSSPLTPHSSLLTPHSSLQPGKGKAAAGFFSAWRLAASWRRVSACWSLRW